MAQLQARRIVRWVVVATLAGGLLALTSPDGGSWVSRAGRIALVVGLAALALRGAGHRSSRESTPVQATPAPATPATPTPATPAPATPAPATPGPRAAAPPTTPSPDDDLSGLTLLVVDDVQMNRRLLETILTKRGANVTLAENGSHGAERCRQAMSAGHAFDAILMDIHMPEMDGYEATTRIRASGYDKPILAVTADAALGGREEFLRQGFDEYVAKPIDKPFLVSRIRSLCGMPPGGTTARAADATAEPMPAVAGSDRARKERL